MEKELYVNAHPAWMNKDQKKVYHKAEKELKVLFQPSDPDIFDKLRKFYYKVRFNV